MASETKQVIIADDIPMSALLSLAKLSAYIENICQQETEALPNIGLNKSVFIEV